jgi:hypothetical protein
MFGQVGLLHPDGFPSKPDPLALRQFHCASHAGSIAHDPAGV